MRGIVVCLALGWGCGGNDGVGADAATPDADICDRGCVESQWWVTTKSNCQAACTIDPTLNECAETDCEMIEARFYDGTDVASLAAVVHSASAESIYVAATPSTDSYTIDACAVTAGATAPQTFSCLDQQLTFQTAVFSVPSAGLEGALLAAQSAGTTGRYPYPQ